MSGQSLGSDNGDFGVKTTDDPMFADRTSHAELLMRFDTFKA